MLTTKANRLIIRGSTLAPNSRCSCRRGLSVEAAPVLRQVLLGCTAAQLNVVRWAALWPSRIQDDPQSSEWGKRA